MKFFVAFLALPALVAAQGIYGPPPAPASGSSSSSSPSSTSSSSAAVPTATSATEHVITVGLNDQFMFSPNNIIAKENDTVTFFFEGSFNHSITQSTFANPCTYMSGGFNSGLQPAGNSFSLKVTNASQPIWFYCEQTTPEKHCGIGMVASINAPTSGSNTFSAFMSKAVALGQSGEGSQTQSPALGSSALGAFASVSATTAPSQAAGSSSGSSGSSSGAERVVLGAGAILAGVVGALYTLA
ncbi:hypothetical protein M422DRAFT_784890 [Sphaerobolus stellatus SS14]|uniref:Blue (type 1) copper domain-containing protein n=1 Tax=Sphaerobolus stellatus (strain SS14) TaxID=990650 RepID=A0A0C9TDX6_SPHS4|nr:hypothetical protein M422DRAFT_784890 [Sphaerobolus stellatus SS14]